MSAIGYAFLGILFIGAAFGASCGIGDGPPYSRWEDLAGATMLVAFLVGVLCLVGAAAELLR
jgi:hypothetical protein